MNNLFNSNITLSDEKQASLDEVLSKYTEFKALFQEIGVNISPRIDIAISNYCRTATKYMSECYRPLDYCIAQRLLPLINLQGDENTKKSIQKLINSIQELSLNRSISINILNRIIENGDKPQTRGIYNYFLTFGY